MVSKSKDRSPWFYIPTLYFAEGLPNVMVSTVSVVMYKNLGVSNKLIGLTSVLYLAWVIKPLWSPAVDIFSTQRRWIVATQAAMSVLFVLLSLMLQLPSYFIWSLLALTFIAFLSATHDIAADGYYLAVLDAQDQAFYVGIRSTFYRIAMIFGSGVLVILAGVLERETGSISKSWNLVMATSAAIYFALMWFHSFYLPHVPKPQAPKSSKAFAAMTEAFKSYFAKDGIVGIIGFLLLYRLGEALLLKMAPPFLLDSSEAGGIGLSTETFGFIYGTVGLVCLVCGGILGGWLISKYGLRQCILPMALAINAPDLAYVYMAYAKPALEMVYAFIAIEQFGYGLGFTAYVVFMMYTAAGEYQTSHYAISTGFMALGLMLPGLVSGYLQELLGYPLFFILVCLLTIPGMLMILFIPIHNEDTINEIE